MLEEGIGQRVSRSRGPKAQDISNSHSNTSLALKKVHVVLFISEIWIAQVVKDNREEDS